MASPCDVIYGFLSRIFEQVKCQFSGSNRVLPEVLIHDIPEEPTACGKVKQIVEINGLENATQYFSRETVQQMLLISLIHAETQISDSVLSSGSEDACLAGGGNCRTA